MFALGQYWSIMPRSPRIEYEGALYHVMCRGDRREAIFADDDDRRMLLATLAAACERTGWRVHAYVLLPNHYHLLLETPRAGLVDGMRWFQTTYTARFNARHHVCGHLFQGRYKAIPLDPADPSRFRILCDYIHLNPVRAHLLPGSGSHPEDYPWSSLPAILGRAVRPSWQETKRLLAAAGMTRPVYAAFLRRRASEIGGANSAQKKVLDEEWREIRRGWALGGDDFRRELVDRLGTRIAPRKRESYSGEGADACDLCRAQALLDRGLCVLHLDLDELRARKTTDPTKQALVWLVRSSSRVSVDWLCATFCLGHRSNLSRAVRAMEAAQDPIRLRLKSKMLQCKD